MYDDLDRATVFIPTSFLTYARVDLFRTSLSKLDIRIVRASEFQSVAMEVKELCSLSKGTLCINSNFFDEQRKPLGLIVERGITLQKIHRGGDTLTGILQKSRDSISIVSRDDFNPTKVTEAIQAGPRLIVDSKIVSNVRELKVPTRRSGACVTKTKELILYSITSGFFGATLSELQSLLTHKDIGCADVLNLDGGSSSQLYFSGSKTHGSEELETSGEELVPVAIALVPKGTE